MLIHDIEFTFGADPEVFVKKGNKNVSAHGLIPGTKAEPFPVNKGAVQVDGMALEFNIEPAKSAIGFKENLATVLKQMGDMVPDHTLVIKPTMNFSKKVMEESPEEALALGCEPDYNAYTEDMNPRPKAPGNFRTGGGHIHIGWDNDIPIDDPSHLDACRAVVKQMDAYIGVLSLLWDDDDKRRSVYGKAGAFRPKSFGVEYRSLSNAWLAHPEIHASLVLLMSRALSSLFVYGGKPITSTTINDQKVRPEDIINSGDKDMALSYVQNYLMYTARGPVLEICEELDIDCWGY